jgi:hypothetical protein
MAWEIEVTDQFFDWVDGLEENEWDAVVNAVDFLQDRDPGLGRPLVDNVHHSRHSNMKELRPSPGNLRILFAFDPRRTAIPLIGGDKSGRWSTWYREMIPIADRLYDDHLDALRREGLLE